MATAVRDAVGSVSEHGTEGDRADSGAADGPNPVEAVVRTVDRFQQRHTGLAFPFAVVKKFGDDGGGVLATSLAYSTFVAVFPLLLLFVTVLGFILGHDQDAQKAVSRSVLVEFPILGDQIVGSLEPLRGSGLALGVGMVGLAWGGLGVTQTVQHAMAEIWNVPGVRRSSFVARLVRGLALLGLGGCGLVATSVLAASSAFNGDLTAAGVAAATGTIVLNVVLLLGLFRMTTVASVPTRQLVVGALLGGMTWTVLQVVGSYLVAHQLRGASEVYGFFATVLGLMSWIFLGSRVLLYAGEANVVLARRLWPRSIVQPPLTNADRAALAYLARQEERRPEETIDVSFEG